MGLRRTKQQGSGECRLHNEETYSLHSPPNIIRVTESKKMRYAGHAARMRDRTGAYTVFVGEA
jgi:hypothetical protein